MVNFFKFWVLFGLLGGVMACTPTPDATIGLDQAVHSKTDTVIATVNGSAIYKSDILIAAQAQSLIDEEDDFPRTDPRFQTVLDELIDQRLLALDAVTQKIDQDEDAKLRLAAARERILSNLRVEHYLRVTVSETAIRRMYEEQAKLAARGDEIRARHILTETKAEAEDILMALKDGTDFATLAKANSIDAGSADRGGDLGYFTSDMLSTDFTKPVFAASKGEIIGPVKSNFGWHIAKVLDRRPAPQPTFEEMRPKIANFMTFDAIQELVTNLRRDAEIEINADASVTEDKALNNDE